MQQSRFDFIAHLRWGPAMFMLLLTEVKLQHIKLFVYLHLKKLQCRRFGLICFMMGFLSVFLG